MLNRTALAAQSANITSLHHKIAVNALHRTMTTHRNSHPRTGHYDPKCPQPLEVNKSGRELIHDPLFNKVRQYIFVFLT